MNNCNNINNITHYMKSEIILSKDTNDFIYWKIYFNGKIAEKGSGYDFVINQYYMLFKVHLLKTTIIWASDRNSFLFFKILPKIVCNSILFLQKCTYWQNVYVKSKSETIRFNRYIISINDHLICLLAFSCLNFVYCWNIIIFAKKKRLSTP